MKTTASLVLASFSIAAFLVASSAPLHAQEGAQDEQQQEATDEPRRVRRLQDSVTTGEEWVPGQGQDVSRTINRKLGLAQRAIEAGNLTSPSDRSALKYFQDVLEIDAQNAQANAGIDQIANTLISRARQTAAGGNRPAAEALLQQARQLRPQSSTLAAAEEEILRNEELEAAQAAAQEAFDSGDMAAALAAYQAVQVIDPADEQADAGIKAIAAQWVTRAIEAIDAGDYDLAQQHLETAQGVDAENPQLTEVAERIESLRAGVLAQMREDIESALRVGDLEGADGALQSYLAAGGGDVEGLQQQLATARRIASFPVGSRFSDATYSPELIVVPAGSFQFGSPESEEGRYNNEGPQKTINFDIPFALGRHEVSVGEFRQFVDATGYETDAEQAGESTIFDTDEGQLGKKRRTYWIHDYKGDRADDEQPVLHVSHNDAIAYVQWLAQQTGESYRLPTETEFEYALRAGTTTAYWWGDDRPSSAVENLAGGGDSLGQWNWTEQGFSSYRDGNWGPTDVASFDPNPFGLHDAGGNALEWVADCYNKDIGLTPDDGGMQQSADCERRVVKGGSWASQPRRSRSAQRTPARPTQASCLVGFRVARDL